MSETDREFKRQVEQLLTEFEKQLIDVTRADTEFVTEAARHIIGAGGKRIRPLLTVLSSKFSDHADRQAVISGALVMELTHAASLYHDDVMDDAQLRRGVESANHRWSNLVAILVGDYLFAKASAIVATLGPEYVELQAKTFSRLVQGQIAETLGPGQNDDPLDFYLKVIADKTGSLIAASALFGGKLAGLDEESLAPLANFGEEIGVIFQLSDDVIDITSNQTGKTPGTDLREGVLTLPTLLLMKSADPADEELKTLISEDLNDDHKLARALKLLRVNPVIEQSRQEIARRVSLAESYLAKLPDSAARKALSKLCYKIAERSR